MTGRRRAGGGWDVTSQPRYCVDDIAAAGIAAQGRPVTESLDLAAEAITHSAGSIYDLYDEEILLGLSGGKDSRVIASALIAAGRLPRFFTNNDTKAEGEVASELMRILRDKRGLQPDHQLRLAGAPAKVLKIGLRERTRRLQQRYDFQFSSTYIPRPASSPRLPNEAGGATFAGAAGELATGYWYPSGDAEENCSPEQQAISRLLHAVPTGVAAESVVAAEHDRVNRLLGHAKDVGLRDLRLVDYVYLLERVRRWSTSAYTVGMVTLFLSPGFVSATFALNPEQKRVRLLHTGLIERLMPEWSDVPFVSVSTGTSTATRVWEGDGLEAIADLVDTAHGPITQLIRREAVVKALVRAARTGRANATTLQQFAYLAVASQQLEPTAIRPSTGATYARVTALPTSVSAKLTSRLQWIKKTPLGNRLWITVRKQVRARRQTG